MPNSQKGFASIAVIIVILIVAGAVGYLLLMRQSAPPTPAPVPTPTPQATAPVPTPTPKSTSATQAETSIEYKNTQYGFSLILSASWKGYTIVVGKWEGGNESGPQGYITTERGPMISIRHPKWTSANPRQDIPIMVLTLSQWDSLQQGKFHIGAAPIEPGELGRNPKYVFALPARYNYAFPTGYEEVERILQSKPLRTF